jgi:hypothetical protein
MKKIVCVASLIIGTVYFLSHSLSWALHDAESAKGGGWKTDNIRLDQPGTPEDEEKIDNILDKTFKKRPIIIPLLHTEKNKEIESSRRYQKGNITSDNKWRYFEGIVAPPDRWNTRGFDDSAWRISAGSFGYGDGKHDTLLGDMRGNYKSVYVRRVYNILDYRKVSGMTLSLFCDGPFIAYLNEIEVIRSRRRQTGEPLNLSGFTHELENGKNILSIKCSNDDINSDDFSFIPYFTLHEK